MNTVLAKDLVVTGSYYILARSVDFNDEIGGDSPFFVLVCTIIVRDSVGGGVNIRDDVWNLDLCGDIDSNPRDHFGLGVIPYNALFWGWIGSVEPGISKPQP